MRELSWLAILLGVVIGALLAAANAFVGLKVGMTVSASIPAAVMSLLILRTLLKRGTLLESNMVQTIGSAGESVAAGMIFTLPALFIMGSDDAVYWNMVIWGCIGGLLGVCFMVPLRHILIVKEHGTLPYPEGVACAEVLQSGEKGGGGAKSVVWGSIFGAAYHFINGLGFWKETGRVSLKEFHTEFQVDSSPAMLGVGYILGPRIAAYMLSGAVLSFFVLIPSIGFFGADVVGPVYPESSTPIAQMTPHELWEQYIRYIGAGAVAVGGLISLFKSFPTILASFWHVLSGMFRRSRGGKSRTEKDIPFPLLMLAIGGIAYAMWRVEAVNIDHIGVFAVLVGTFFFVTVSSRLVGLVGSSSNPVSGMTIATLLGTAMVYKIFVLDRSPGMSPEDLTALKVTCLSIGAIVCIGITIGGDTSQDLKTGYLVKATPYKQQVGEVIGVVTSVLVIAGLLLLLNNTYGFVETPEQPNPLPAYQANIMKILVDGVLGGQVPWTLIMMGGAAAIIVEMLGLPALPFAVGMYLPLGLSTPIMVGGIVRWLIDRKRGEKSDHDAGVLTASGLVAGYGLMGVAFAGALAFLAWWWKNPSWINPLAGAGALAEPVSYTHFVPWVWSSFVSLPQHWGLSDAWWDALPFFPFFMLTLWLWWCARKRPTITLPPIAPVIAGPPEPLMPATLPGPDAPTSVVKPATPAAQIGPYSSAIATETPTDSQPSSPEPQTSSIFPPKGGASAPKYRAGQPIQTESADDELNKYDDTTAEPSAQVEDGSTPTSPFEEFEVLEPPPDMEKSGSFPPLDTIFDEPHVSDVTAPDLTDIDETDVYNLDDPGSPKMDEPDASKLDESSTTDFDDSTTDSPSDGAPDR